MATMHPVEVLKDLNENPDNYAKYEDNTALKITLGFAFLENQRFCLPDGNPPYKPADTPIGMCPINFLAEVKKLNIFTNRDLNKLKREAYFIQLLEGVSAEEAILLLHVKDQTLLNLYPNLSVRKFVEHGILPPWTLDDPRWKEEVASTSNKPAPKKRPSRAKKPTNTSI